MTDHPRLTRYIVYANGTTFMGMLKQNNTHPELFGPDFDWTHGPYVLASEADAEIDRLRAEVEALRATQTVVLREAGALMEMWRGDWSGMDFDGRDTLRTFERLRAWAEKGEGDFTECTDWQKRLDDER